MVKLAPLLPQVFVVHIKDFQGAAQSTTNRERPRVEDKANPKRFSWKETRGIEVGAPATKARTSCV